MRFEEALKVMREGKKVKSKKVIYSLFIADYPNGFGETYKAICWKDSLGNLIYHSLNHNDIFAEDWEVVEDDNK